MKRIPRRRRRLLSVSMQGAKLKSVQPKSKVRYPGGSKLVWEGSVNPSSETEIYQIRIRYKLGTSRPNVHVLKPVLRTRNSDPIPHTYPDNELCLYRGEYGEWNGTMWIADTILPWTSLWLYFYELWHATGQWLGGGEHPGEGKAKN